MLPSDALGAERVPGLLPTMQRVAPIRRRAVRQDGERLSTEAAQPTPYPKVIVLAIVRRLTTLPVPNDGCLLTEGAPTRQLVQTDPRYPGSALSSAGGNEIKRITAGVKACRWFSLPGLVLRPAFTLLMYSISNKKRILSSLDQQLPPACGLAGIKGLTVRYRSHRLASGGFHSG